VEQVLRLIFLAFVLLTRVVAVVVRSLVAMVMAVLAVHSVALLIMVELGEALEMLAETANANQIVLMTCIQQLQEVVLAAVAVPLLQLQVVGVEEFCLVLAALGLHILIQDQVAE
jgi:hypothetical protein